MSSQVTGEAEAAVDQFIPSSLGGKERDVSPVAVPWTVDLLPGDREGKWLVTGE